MSLFPLQACAVLFPRVVHWGGLRVPVYGLLAVLGLVLAFWLSQRTARVARISPEKLWDAGVFAVAAALVISRLLLVLEDPKAFLRYPLLVLSLPSLTYGGMLLTAVFTYVYVRRQGVPVWNVLDAWAPPAALLGAALQLGDYFAGSDAGLPMATGGRMPVGVWGAGLAMLICGGLGWRLRHRTRLGEVAGLALVAGGLLPFLLDMLREPEMGLSAGSWLEPSQWIALGAMLAGSVVWCLGAGVVPRASELRSADKPGPMGQAVVEMR